MAERVAVPARRRVRRRHGPVGVNQQIARDGRPRSGAPQALAKAGGLSPGQHRFWADAAARREKRLAVLRKELTTERAWRYQLQLDELGLDKQIRAAGNLPGLPGPVRGWKAQLKSRRYTVGQINNMLNATGAPSKAESAGLAAAQDSRLGRMYLNAWKSRHGGGWGAAWGPVVLNEQIARVSAARGSATTLSRAPGLSAAQHKHWAATAASEARRLAVLRKELGIEQAWRGQIAAADAGLARDIAAARNVPSLAKNVTGWKAAMARDRATIAGDQQDARATPTRTARRTSPPRR